MKRFAPFAALCAAALVCAPAQAALIRFTVPLEAGQEVLPATGQPGGAGVATLFIDNIANTVFGSVSFNTSVTTPLSGFHIHEAVAGVNGGIVVRLESILLGETVTDVDLARIVANPSGFYVNAHNTPHPNGAVRGQMNASQAVIVPEAGTLSLVLGAASVLGAVVVRRRKAA